MSSPDPAELRSLVAEVLQEFMASRRDSTEPALKAELENERAARRAMEKKIADLEATNRQAAERADRAERLHAVTEALISRRARRPEVLAGVLLHQVSRSSDGTLLLTTEDGRLLPLSLGVDAFIRDNPEFTMPTGTAVPPAPSVPTDPDASERTDAAAPSQPLDPGPFGSSAFVGMSPAEIDWLKARYAEMTRSKP